MPNPKKDMDLFLMSSKHCLNLKLKKLSIDKKTPLNKLYWAYKFS